MTDAAAKSLATLAALLLWLGGSWLRHRLTGRHRRTWYRGWAAGQYLNGGVE